MSLRVYQVCEGNPPECIDLMLSEVPPKTFTFARERLVTRTIPKEVKLKGEYSSSTTAATFQTAIRDKLAVSPSGRTLSDILCLSCPDLSQYAVTSVHQALWGKAVVTYSRPESMTNAVIISFISPVHPLILV
jgi:hypothetical protein